MNDSTNMPLPNPLTGELKLFERDFAGLVDANGEFTRYRVNRIAVEHPIVVAGRLLFPLTHCPREDGIEWPDTDIICGAGALELRDNGVWLASAEFDERARVLSSVGAYTFVRTVFTMRNDECRIHRVMLTSRREGWRS